MKSYKDASAQYTKRASIGIMITKAGYTGSVWKPKWSKAGEARAETHIRFVGPLNEAGTNFMPWRNGPEQNEFSQWLIRVPMFTGGTVEPLSFIAAFEDPENPGELLDTDVNPTPATVFLKHATKIAKQDPALKMLLLDGSASKPAALPKKLAAVGLAQGILLRHGGKDYYTRPQCPAMFMLSPGACWSLEDLLNKEVENYNGDPLNLPARFVSGDLLDAATGRIVSLFNAQAGVAAPASASDEAAVNWSKAGGGGGERPAVVELPRYSCELKAKLPMPRDAQGKIVGPGGKSLFTPWEKALRMLDTREQVEVLCRAYGDLPGLLQDCLRQYKEYWPKFLRGDAAVTMPTTSQAAVTAARTVSNNVPDAAPDADQAMVDWGNAGTALNNQDDVEPLVQLPTGDALAGANTQAASANDMIAAEKAKTAAAMAKLAAMKANIGK